MKLKEKQQAIALRQKGWSINSIYKQVGVSKGSVSLWVRNIELTTTQKKQLSQNGHTRTAIENRRSSRLKNEQLKRQRIIDAAEKEVSVLSSRELFVIGTALYWAEGGKTQRGNVRLANGDPKLIKTMMRFFREICNVPESKFKGHIHIHPHLNPLEAEEYWFKISGISKNKFFKTYRKPNKASLNKKDSLPYGTFQIYVCDTNLFLRIKGWINGIAKQ